MKFFVFITFYVLGDGCASSDDGKRSALYVLVDKGYQGDSSIQSFGLATPGRGRRIFLRLAPSEGSPFLHDVIDRTPLFGGFLVKDELTSS